jgi:glucuronate isomerase
MDANFLGGLVARHIIDEADAHLMARAMAYDLGKATYRFDAAAPLKSAVATAT